MTDSITRRHFLRTGAAAGGGLVVAVWLSGCSDDITPEDSPSPAPPGGRAGPDALQQGARLGAYVAILPDGRIVIRAPCPEIGQGVRIALPMIVAEELGARWSDVLVEQAPAVGAENAVYGSMTVGGSDSVADYWLPLREAGAVARASLCAAAAARWDVDPEFCDARDSQVTGPRNRSLSFAELAVEAASIDATGVATLRDPAEHALVGTDPERGHVRAITDGTAVYGHDVRIPGMRFAVVIRPPVPGARVERFDPAPALAIEGVERVVEVPGVVPRGLLYGAVAGGVAVLAHDTWAAMRGAEVLEVEWDRTSGDADDAAWRATARAALERPPGRWLRDEGGPGRDQPSVAEPGTTLEAWYDLPLLAHICMEPVNFTAAWDGERCELRGPTQAPLNLQVLAAEALGVPREAVSVFPTLAGGGFGRRLAFDYGIEAALLSRAAGVPVQVVWPRDQDVRHDYFRPPAVHRLRGRVGAQGRVTEWEHRLATVSLNRNIRGPEATPPELYDVQGAADLPYRIPRIRFGWTDVPLNLQLGSWRSVSHSFNVFAVESFVDELAVAAGRDPLELRLDLLAGAGDAEIVLPLPGRRGRPAPNRDLLAGVLRAVADDARWAGDPGSRRSSVEGGEIRRGRGLACCYYKQSYAAHVADVSVDPDGGVRVERITTVLDCGRVVHPDGLLAQMEGAALDGTATVLHWGLTLRDGRVQESNFDGFPGLRHTEAPEVAARAIVSDRDPSGAGEPPYPAVPAAITNAIFDATGVRIRRLPLAAGQLR